MDLSIVLFWSLLCHLVGDYLLQSDWMAQQKTKWHLPALVHAFTYSLPFCGLIKLAKYDEVGGILALFTITSTHFLIDRYRLARYVCWAKNFLAPSISPHEGTGLHVWWRKWEECKGTGYHDSRPPWMAVWLLIIADNTMHLVINAIALSYFWS